MTKVYVLVEEDGERKTLEYDYPGYRRKWSIVMAMNALRAIRPRIEGEILDIRTKRSESTGK